MPSPTEDPVRQKLRQLGAADYVIRGGAEGLVAAWRQFIGQVEKGYPLGLDDYRNDLDIRSLISETGLEDRVRAEDDRLRALLTRRDQQIWESDMPHAFWIHGYPKNASGELLEDLVAEGLA